MKLRSMFLTALLLLWAAVPSFADVAFKDLMLRKKGTNLNVRVVVTNPGSARQAGPVSVQLFVRETAEAQWEPIKKWDDIRFIQPGYSVAKDFFEENNQRLADLVRTGRFEVRAVVSAPGCPDVERVEAFKGDE